MNKEIIKEVFGENFDINVNSMNIEVMKEVATTTLSTDFDFSGTNIDDGTSTEATVTYGGTKVQLTGSLQACETGTTTAVTGTLFTGNSFDYVLTLTNNSNIQASQTEEYTAATATDVVITMLIPNHMNFSISGVTGDKKTTPATTFDNDSRVLTINANDIAPGESDVIKIAITMTATSQPTIS